MGCKTLKPHIIYLKRLEDKVAKPKIGELRVVDVHLGHIRQVVVPIQALKTASKRIAEGKYEERVQVTGDIPKQEQDEFGQLALSFNFTRFYRMDKSRSRQIGGSGIGLTIARHLVEAHGGRIWAESPGIGKGSTSGFTLPIA